MNVELTAREAQTRAPNRLSMFAYLWTLETRSFEIFAGLAHMCLGIVTMLPGQQMRPAVYEVFLSIAPEFVWGGIQAAIGLIGFWGAIINGFWQARTLPVRLTTLTIGAAFWAVLAVTFWEAWPGGARAMVTYLILCFGSIWSFIHLAVRG